MKPLHVEAIGLVAPGLNGWSEAAAVLRADQPYQPAPLPPYAPQLLPQNERRRATAAVRLAFRAAEDALAGGACAPAELASVFATSDADTEVMQRICTALAQPQRVVSPTDFHNSVHNAAAGYWSIAAGCRKPSVALSAWEGSFAAGLVEACTLAHGDGTRVLLVCYDILAPSPLDRAGATSTAVGAAMVLAPDADGRDLPRLQLSFDGDRETPMADAALEALRLSNPAARALPLLALLAAGGTGAVALSSGGGGYLTVSLR